MTNLIVAGAAGRMGRILTGLIARDPAYKLVAAVEASGARRWGRTPVR